MGVVLYAPALALNAGKGICHMYLLRHTLASGRIIVVLITFSEGFSTFSGVLSL